MELNMQELLRNTDKEMVFSELLRRMDLIKFFSDVSRNTNVNELFNEFEISSTQLRSSKGINARHFEGLTDRYQIRDNQMLGMRLGLKTVVYRNRIIQLSQSEEEMGFRGALLDVYSHICLDDTKVELRRTIRNAIVQNRKYCDLDKRTQIILNILKREFDAEAQAIKRADVSKYLI